MIGQTLPSYGCCTMTGKEGQEIDWSLGTWEGSRRAQHRTYLELPFRAKLEALEEMGELVQRVAKRRAARGLRTIGPGGKPLEP